MELDGYKARFIGKLLEKTKEPGRLTVMRGYLGDADANERVRLYPSLDLANHIDLPEEAVIHVEPVEGSSYGAVTLWVSREAELEIAHKPAKALAEFMDGLLTRDIGDLVPSGGGAMAITAVGPPTSFALVSPYAAGTLPGVTPMWR